MPEKLSADGGTILELDTVQAEPISGPNRGKRVELYYLEGVGFRFKKFGQDAQDLGNGGSVSPLTTKGDIYGFSTAGDRLAVGSNGKVLTADSTKALGLDWKTPSASPLTTKGDLHGFSSVDARLVVGTNGQILVADSAAALGVRWATGSGTVDATAFHDGGDSFGHDAVIGTEDNHAINFETNGAVVGGWRTDGGLFVGTETTSYISGRDVVLVRRDQNEHTAVCVVNEDLGEAALSAFALFSATNKSCEMALFGPGLTPFGYAKPDQCSINSVGLTNGIKIITRDAAPVIIGTNQQDIITIGADTSIVMGGDGTLLGTEGLRATYKTLIDATATNAFSVNKGGDATPVFIVDTTNGRVSIGGSNTFGGELEVRHDFNGNAASYLINEHGGADAAQSFGVIAGPGNARSIGLNVHSTDGGASGDITAYHCDEFVIRTLDAKPIIFKTGNVAVMRLDPDGAVLPPGGDNTGTIGESGIAWANIWIKNAAHVGDLIMSDKKMGTKWTLREAKIKGEDKDALYAINGRNGKKFKLAMMPA